MASLFSSMSNDLLLCIFSNLSAQNLARVAQTCTSWNEASKHDQLWISLLRKTWGANISAPPNSSGPWGKDAYMKRLSDWKFRGPMNLLVTVNRDFDEPIQALLFSCDLLLSASASQVVGRSVYSGAAIMKIEFPAPKTEDFVGKVRALLSKGSQAIFVEIEDKKVSAKAKSGSGKSKHQRQKEKDSKREAEPPQRSFNVPVVLESSSMLLSLDEAGQVVQRSFKGGDELVVAGPDALCFTAQSLVASGHLDGNVRVWDGGLCCSVLRTGSVSPVRHVTWVGKRVVSIADDGVVCIWAPVAAGGGSNASAPAPPGRGVCDPSGAWVVREGDHTHAATALCAPAGMPPPSQPEPPVGGGRAYTLRHVGTSRGAGRGVRCLGGCGRTQFAVGFADGSMELWDAKAGTWRVLRGLAIAVACLAYDRFARVIIAGGDDGCLKIWDADSGRCLRTVAGAHAGAVSAIAVDEFRVATAGLTDLHVKLWDFKRRSGTTVGAADRRKKDSLLKDLKVSRKGDYESDWRGIRVDGRRSMRDLAARCKPSAARDPDDHELDDAGYCAWNE